MIVCENLPASNQCLMLSVAPVLFRLVENVSI